MISFYTRALLLLRFFVIRHVGTSTTQHVTLHHDSIAHVVLVVS